MLTGLLILILASVGNAEWWVILINHRHALRITVTSAKKIRWLHDAALVFTPILFLIFAGLRTNGLLRGGTWSDLPVLLQLILGFAIAGCLSLLWCMVQWQLQAPCRKREVIKLCNFSAESDVRGSKPSPFLKVPGNQILKLEVNRKQITVPREGAAADVLRIAHFSDLHVFNCPGLSYFDKTFEELKELTPDVFIFTGDTLDCPDLLEKILPFFKELLTVAPGYFILGNHDALFDQEAIRAGIVSTGWTNAGGLVLETDIAGHSIVMAGSEAPWIGENPTPPADGSHGLRLLLSHTPDQRDYAVKGNYDLMLSGHNHGGQIVLPFIGPVYSPSRFGVRYAGGLFQHGHLHMHVSRGVASKDPLRINCLPEISLLEIQWAGNSQLDESWLRGT